VATVEATSVGPVALQLGALSTSLGRFGEAERHLEEALEITEKLEAPYWTALTQLEWAKMLRARADEGDEATAVSLVSESAQSARELGFGQLERAALDFGVVQ
jgi:hypothetical protein